MKDSNLALHHSASGSTAPCTSLFGPGARKLPPTGTTGNDGLDFKLKYLNWEKLYISNIMNILTFAVLAGLPT